MVDRTSGSFQPAFKKTVKALIRAYQLGVSPLMLPHCRFLPTCSDFSLMAIEKHGVFSGGLLSVGRLCRCHPWGGSGYDPVPETLSNRS